MDSRVLEHQPLGWLVYSTLVALGVRLRTSHLPPITNYPINTPSEALSKESHFLGGLLGAGACARSAALYRSFFPTVITRWWREAALGSRRWQCFDATPTYACLPHVPARVAVLTPNSKVVFMVREPTAAVFSAESMLRGMGVPLGWSLARPLAAEGDEDVEAPGRGGGVEAGAAGGSRAALLQVGRACRSCTLV